MTALDREDSLSRVDLRPRAVSGLASTVPLPGRSSVGSTLVLRLIASGGRVLLVWFGVFAAYAQLGTTLAPALPAVCILTCIWLLALRASFRSGNDVLGPGIACAVGCAFGLAGASAVRPWLPGPDVPLLTLTLTAAGVYVFVLVWEVFVRRTNAAACRVLVVGHPECARSIDDEIRRTPHSRFSVVGLVEVDTAGLDSPGAATPWPLEYLQSVVRAERPNVIVLTDPVLHGPALDLLLDVADVGFRVVPLPTFFEHAFGRVPVRDVTPAWFMGMLHLQQRPYTRFSKRAFDLVVAGIAAILAAPLFALLALLVRLTPGPVIYRQTRMGEGGRTFTMYKFRTMSIDAEADGVAMLATRADPRTTRIGWVLRRTHLDELPQLWNVLKGDMSIVGPRPERPELVTALENEIPFWSRRVLVRPGITGWAQIMHGYASDQDGMREKLSFDLWYLRHRNLLVDAAICAKTFLRLLVDTKSC